MQARHRRYTARRLYLKTKAASILAQSARRALMARKRVAALRRNRAASRVAAAWRGRKERRAYELLRTNAVTIQKVQRRRAAAVFMRRWQMRQENRPSSRTASRPWRLNSETPSLRMKRRKAPSWPTPSWTYEAPTRTSEGKREAEKRERGAQEEGHGTRTGEGHPGRRPGRFSSAALRGTACTCCEEDRVVAASR